MGLIYESVKQLMKAIKLAPDKSPRAASFGYQDVYLTLAEARELFGENGLRHLWIRLDHYPPSDPAEAAFGLRVLPVDQAGRLFDDPASLGLRTAGLPQPGDPLLFESFSLFDLLGCHCQALDLIAHLGVETPVDLSQPLPAAFHGVYDLVVDAGTIEHCFNAAESLKNMVRLLKKGGLALHSSPLNWRGHGFYNFDPQLFHDFYEANGFRVIDCFIVKDGRKINLGRSDYSSVEPAPNQLLNFLALKETEIGRPVEPVQGSFYEFYKRQAGVYSFGPLLAAAGRPAESDPTERLTETDSFCDAVARGLRLIGDHEALSRVREDSVPSLDPNTLLKYFNDRLSLAHQQDLKAATTGLVGQPAWFVVRSQSVYERYKKLVDGIEKAGLVLGDAGVDDLNLRGPDGDKIFSQDQAFTLKPDLTVLVFAERPQLARLCREICVRHPRGLNAPLLAFW